MQLINAQGVAVQEGARLRAIQGRETGQVWRYSHVVEHPIDGHRVHVSRRHLQLGHIHREFHPGVFGLHVKVDVTWRKHLRNKVHHFRVKFDEYLIAGIVALLPLALFEQYHLAERVTEVLPFLGH